MKLKSVLQEHPNLDLSGFPLFAQINRQASKVITILLPMFAFLFMMITFGLDAEIGKFEQVMLSGFIAMGVALFGLVYSYEHSYTTEITICDGKVVYNRFKLLSTEHWEASLNDYDSIIIETRYAHVPRHKEPFQCSASDFTLMYGFLFITLPKVFHIYLRHNSDPEKNVSLGGFVAIAENLDQAHAFVNQAKALFKLPAKEINRLKKSKN